MAYKQVIVVRADLRLSAGKTAAQVAHAAYTSAMEASLQARRAWEKEGQRKVVLQVQNIGELRNFEEKCEKARLPHAIIADAGLTELPPGTVTCLGIGPAPEEKLDRVTGSLPLLK
jgi:PTH2 family peptidyl-tRNA hydrolase